VSADARTQAASSPSRPLGLLPCGAAAIGETGCEPTFEFTGGRIVKVVPAIADVVYIGRAIDEASRAPLGSRQTHRGFRPSSGRSTL
jgi:hypothetical protein